jgi:hypothetical protein
MVRDVVQAHERATADLAWWRAQHARVSRAIAKTRARLRLRLPCLSARSRSRASRRRVVCVARIASSAGDSADEPAEPDSRRRHPSSGVASW